MKREEDFLYKIDAIRNILKSHNFDCVEIKSQANFSFITRGRGFIGLASVIACGTLFITDNNIYLVTENIEAERLHREQLNTNPFIKILQYPWNEPNKREIIVRKINNGLKMATEKDFEQEFFNLRTLITPYDQSDYKELGKECAIIIENICKNLKKDISEYELAGKIAKQFWSNNIEPITTLIAFDKRALQYRHPVMTDNRLENYALISICGRRNGLIVSLSRSVLINSDLEIIEKHNKCAMVNATLLNELKIDNSIENIFQHCIEQYSKQGYPLEYKEHHQGGLTGFVSRELKINKGCLHKVRENEVYAFNPTIQGTKCEETVLVTKNGFETMTYTGTYTYLQCNINEKTFIMPSVYVINK